MLDEAGATDPADRAGGRSTWRSIAEALRIAIHDGAFGPGGRVPPEREIARRFGSTRVTAKRAISALEAEGLLLVRQGVGAFVNQDTVYYRWASGFASIGTCARSAGRRGGRSSARRISRPMPGRPSGFASPRARP